MAYWYRARFGAIQRVKVVKETEFTLTIVDPLRKESLSKPVKVRKQGIYDNYFPTWEEARQSIQKEAEAKMADARRQLEQAEKFLDDAKGMKNPWPV